MNRLYLVTFSHLTIKELSQFFDATPAIGFWFYSMPNSIFIKTNLLSQALQDLIQNKFGKEPLLFIIEIKPGDNFTGWIPNEHLKYF